MTWREAIRTSRIRWALLFCTATLCMMVFYMPSFYHDIIRPKESILVYDPLLAAMTPVDWSLPIFTLLYIAALQTVFSSFLRPVIFLTGLTTYCAVSITRMATIFLITLEPPADMILLVDPITTFLVYPDSGFAKDLFFSGHVSTMWIFVLVERNAWARMFKIAATLTVGVLLAWQHVHYTLDLVVAPVITVLIFGIVAGLLKGPETLADR